MISHLSSTGSSENSGLVSKRGDISPKTRDGICILKCGQMELYSAPGDYIFGGERQRFKHIVTVNAEIFVLAHENSEYMRLLHETTNTIDGRVVQLLCKLIYPQVSVNRLPGADMIYDLAKYCDAQSEKLFLLGSTEDALKRAIESLRTRNSNLQISGFSPPISRYPFPRSINQEILDRIAAFQPVHLVVCFGPVKQERWIHDHSGFLTKTGVRRAYGFGGTIDFLASKQKRAPKVLQLLGVEWLFRLICEPRTRFRRTLTMFRMPFYIARTRRAIRNVEDSLCYAETRLMTQDH